MLTFPNAKINLGLNIIAKRPDGYHDLVSVFVPVGWSDVLEIIPKKEFKFTATGILIPGSAEDNLVVRIYKQLQQQYDLPPVHIHLHKVVPIGAGMGGGSADAAFALRLLNDMFALGLSREQMEDYVRPLGADCAFFVGNTPMFCYEKGDRFTSISLPLQDKTILIVYPGIHISTKEAYASVSPKAPERDLLEILKMPMEKWKGKLVNDFELGLFPKYPLLAQLKQQIYDLGAVYASMTGSGSAIYGIFDQPEVNTESISKDYTFWHGKL